MTILEVFFPRKEEVDYNRKDVKRLTMCPNRKDFCCTVPELMSMYGHFKRGQRDLDSIFDYHNFFYQNFRSNSPKRIKKLITSWKNPIAKSKMPAEVYSRIEKDIDYINDRIERINLSFIVVKDFILRFYGGFLCNLCGPRPSNAFQINVVSPQERILEVTFSVTLFKELVNVNTYYMYYLKYLSKLLNVVELFLYYIGDVVPKRTLLFEDSYQKQLQTYVECKKLLTDINIERNVDQAFKKCRSAFKLVSNLRQAEGLTDILQTLQKAHDYLSNSFPVLFYQINDPRRMVTPLFFGLDETAKLGKLVTFTEYKPVVQVKIKRAEMEPVDEKVDPLAQKITNEYEIFIDPTSNGMNEAYIFGSAQRFGSILGLLFLCWLNWR
jgi:hypothetical protein